MMPVLAQLKQDFADELQVVYRHFPIISIHDKAALATAASEAAGLQDQFWAMHDVIYEQQSEWSQLSIAAFQEWLIARAEEINGLDSAQFTADLKDPVVTAVAQNAYNAAIESGIPGTPFLLINGRVYNGPADYENLSIVIRLFGLQEKQYQACPAMVIDSDRNYQATIETVKGEIKIDLFSDRAPAAVSNFVFLARAGFYDGVTFHRVFPGYIAQAGDPSGTGFGGPGYIFNHEDNGLKFEVAGLVAIDPETNGSQFFITYEPIESLDEGNYTIFGQIIEGLEILRNLSGRDPRNGVNQPPGDEILRITIEEN